MTRWGNFGTCKHCRYQLSYQETEWDSCPRCGEFWQEDPVVTVETVCINGRLVERSLLAPAAPYIPIMERDTAKIEIWTLGIDPGTDGGAALFRDLKLEKVLSFKFDPSWEQTLKGWCLLGYPDHVCVEYVHAFGGEGARSMFTFGKFNKGAVESVCNGWLARPSSGKWSAFDDEPWEPSAAIEYFEPTAWQNYLQLPKRREIADTGRRRTARRRDQTDRALLLFPELANVEGDIFGAVLIGLAGARGLRGKQRDKLTQVRIVK